MIIPKHSRYLQTNFWHQGPIESCRMGRFSAHAVLGCHLFGPKVGRAPPCLLFSCSPGCSSWSPGHSVGFVVADEALFLRVPLERPIQQHRDIAKVADRSGAMAGLGAADRVFTALDAVEEVSLVVVTFVKAFFVRSDYRGQQRFGLGLELAAVDVYPALGSFEPRAAAS